MMKTISQVRENNRIRDLKGQFVGQNRRAASKSSGKGESQH